MWAHCTLSSLARHKVCPPPEPPMSRQALPHWITYALQLWVNTAVLCPVSHPPTPHKHPDQRQHPRVSLFFTLRYAAQSLTPQRQLEREMPPLVQQTQWYSVNCSTQTPLCISAEFQISWQEVATALILSPDTITLCCQTYRERIWASGKLCAAASLSWCKGGPLRSAGCWAMLVGYVPARSHWESQRPGFLWGRCATPALHHRHYVGHYWCTGCELWLRNTLWNLWCTLQQQKNKDVVIGHAEQGVW